MSTFVVQNITGTNEWPSKAGGAMITYKMAGLLDGQVESNVEINTVKAKPKVPVAQETIECEIVSRNEYGVKIRRLAPVQGQTEVSSNPTKKWEPNPSTDFPYLSLKAAVEFAGHKLVGNPKLDITGEQVVAMAKVFEKYLKGVEISTLTHNPPLRDAQQVLTDGEEFSMDEMPEEL